MILLALWGLTSIEVQIGGGHEQFASMAQGSAGNAIINTSYLSLFFGISTFTVLILSLLVGLGARVNLKSSVVLIISGSIMVFVLISIFFTYNQFIQSESLQLIHGFPLPTILIIYGIWIYPLVFTLLYVLNFKRWVISPDEIELFKEMIAHKDNPS